MVRYTCLYCKKVFDKKWNYNCHNKSCENKFNKIINMYKSYNKDNLIKEYNDIIKANKNKDKEYICNTCKKSYTTYNGLKFHLKNNGCEKTKLGMCDKIKQKLELKNTNPDTEIKNINVNIKTKVKYKKTTIPHSLKRVVWNYWIGDDYAKSKCLCCNLTTISQMNFCCGHIVAEINGGKLLPENLKPICQSCNSSMGTSNMDEFILKYGLKQKNYDKINFNQHDDLTDLIKLLTKKIKNIQTL